MKKKLIAVSLSLIFFCAAFFALPQSGFAKTNVFLPVPPILQHISPQENGDSGKYNCTVAASAMILLTLYAQGKLEGTSSTYDYASVRTILRQAVPSPQKGIPLSQVSTATSLLARKTLQASITKVDPFVWERTIAMNLLAGFPIMAYVVDWSFLDGHAGKNPAAHVVVIAGMDEDTITYADSWDGEYHTMTKDAFGAAWANGHYNWQAVIFSRPPSASFAGVLQQQR